MGLTCAGLNVHHGVPALRSIVRHVLAPALAGVFGRRNLGRLARLLSQEAGLDQRTDDMRTEGEADVLRAVLQTARNIPSPVLMDVGANLGDWSSLAAEAATEIQLANPRIIAFEPTPATHSLLSERLKRQGMTDRVEAVQAAMSDQCGTQTFFVLGPGEGRNSLVRLEEAGTPKQQELTVRCDTIDAYCARQEIESVLMLKVDAEGHDLSVLKGAKSMLSRQHIRYLQFEYNQRWIDSRSFLKDAFDLLLSNNYHVGKVTRRGIEQYQTWNFELETWRQANYLAWRDSAPCPVPSFPWWNS